MRQKWVALVQRPQLRATVLYCVPKTGVPLEEVALLSYLNKLALWLMEALALETNLLEFIV